MAFFFVGNYVVKWEIERKKNLFQIHNFVVIINENYDADVGMTDVIFFESLFGFIWIDSELINHVKVVF